MTFITEYYIEFGAKCPFKNTGMMLNKDELEKQYEPIIQKDIPLLTTFFKANIRELMEEEIFTPQEIEQLKYLDHYWDIPKINFMYTCQFKIERYTLFQTAIKYGDLRILGWLKKNKIPFHHKTIETAIVHGDLEIMEWLKDNDCPYSFWRNSNTYKVAIENGKLDMVLWLQKNGYKYYLHWSLYKDALETESLDIMKWLLANKCPLQYKVFEKAVEIGNLTIMKWLLDNKCHWSSNVMDVSPLILKNIKWLKSKGVPLSRVVLMKAVENNNLEIIYWCIENGDYWLPFMYEPIIEKDNFDLMERLYEKKCELDISAFNTAIETGNLKIMNWLYERKCPWNSSTFSIAVEMGNLRLMNWLYEKKCPWDYKLYTIAAEKNDLEIMDWLKEKGCPCDKNSLQIFGNHNKVIEKWIKEN